MKESRPPKKKILQVDDLLIFRQFSKKSVDGAVDVSCPVSHCIEVDDAL